jgi:hypothetical protein
MFGSNQVDITLELLHEKLLVPFVNLVQLIDHELQKSALDLAQFSFGLLLVPDNTSEFYEIGL